MKIKFLATGRAPKTYKINGETINGYDLSVVEYGGFFIWNEEIEKAGIRNVFRDEDGTLFVTLKQCVISSKIPGKKAHWRESEYMDISDYNSTKCYVVPTGVADLAEGKDYQIVKGLDCTGTEGWTITEIKNDLV